MSKKIYVLFGLFAIAALLLVGCGPNEETPVVTDAPPVDTGGGEETPTDEAPPPVDVVTPEPVTRVGGWLDMIVFIEDPSPESAVARMDVGEIDIYAYTVADAAVFETVKANPDLKYTTSVGSYNVLMYNYTCVDQFEHGTFPGSGALNPFCSALFRQAMGMLVDREYIIEEILGGLGIPKFNNMSQMFPDYARNVAIAKELEAEFGYNPEKALTWMTEVMEGYGATLEEGAWTFNGEPVEVVFLIRVEDERLEYGHYVANLLEDFGLVVDRQEKTGSEASAIWFSSTPQDGEWNLYTGGWISSAISRDDGGDYAFFDTTLAVGWPLWAPHEEFNDNDAYWDCADRLQNNDFADFEERGELFAVCLRGMMEYQFQTFLYDQTSFTPMRNEIQVAADLAAAVAGGDLWALTIRREGEVGGAMTIAMPELLVEPWNPVYGSSWVYDQGPMTGTKNQALWNDPYTGLNLPALVVSGEAYITEGYPVTQTLDWVTLEFVPEIVVPDDAWADWDAVNQTFLTVADLEDSGRTAVAKYVCTYTDDLLETQWHDGSFFSLGDMVMHMILTFDWAKEDSAIFDEDQVGVFNSFMSSFKGWRVTSTDPVVVEYYTDVYGLDAEEGFNDFRCGYPSYGDYGHTGPWHMLALGLMTEAEGTAAFAEGKAQRVEGEWLTYIGGPSLDLLAEQLVIAADTGYLPYAPTMSQFVTEEEVAARWANYQDWETRKGHYWVGNGPYYLERAFPVENTIILKHFANFPDLADKWSGFSAPKLADISVDGPGRVTAGAEATFDIYVDFAGAPYPLAEMDGVKVLVFDATGALVWVGDAEAVEDGLFQFTLDADTSGLLTTGSSRIEVIAVSKVVAIPTSSSFEFVVE